MPRSSFSGALTGPQVDVVIDLGNPLLNHIVDGFLKIGTVAATRAVAEDAFSAAKKRSISTSDFKHTLKKMCKEGAYWGTVAGLYVGAEYGIERVGGHRDWTSIGTSASAHPFSSDILQKNALLGGALTGALVSAASKENKDKVLVDAITGGAIATAVEFINYLT
ncbi:outer envelope pore protein 16, chloroplastic-like isoform X1 [Malus domestica]|uniref:outer envelope pore protein 16, chloroplastic-like isoform X1 n=1 Tax=Malus domestica TaxID=3750 RepID=UPI0010AACEB9|nr:outer envelope pore protein 16, chloroplastic-like isoform X1 [Malus domestica]